MWDPSSEKLRSRLRVYRGLGITRVVAHGPQSSGLPVTGKYSMVYTSAPRKNPKELFFTIDFSNHLTNSLHLIKF